MTKIENLKMHLKEWQDNKAGAEERLAEMRQVLLRATLDDKIGGMLHAMKSNVIDAAAYLNICEYQVIGLEGAIAYEEGVEAGTINLSDGRDTEDLIDELRLEQLR